MKEKVICPICGNRSTKFLETSDICQSCYRKLLLKYSFYNYKKEISLKKGTNAEKICKMVVEEGLDSKEIAEQLNLNRVYVRQIINAYLYRCDTNGNPRPAYLIKDSK